MFHRLIKASRFRNLEGLFFKLLRDLHFYYLNISISFSTI